MAGPRFSRRGSSTDTQLEAPSSSLKRASLPAFPFVPLTPAPGPRSAQTRYEILEEIHRGGMGEILLGQLTTPSGFRRRVVLKGLLSRLSTDDVSHALFMREAHLMAQLDHPNIVRVFDLPEIEGRPYLAMELVRGHDLHEVVQRCAARRTLVPAPIALTVVSEALRGLHSAHCLRDETGASMGLVHRDVSPGNILLSFYGEVKVTDFGIATIAGSPKYTGPRTIRGKARYVAPEQVQGQPATVASDIYSAGVVLAETLMGAPLWERGTVAETLMAIVSDDRAAALDRILAGRPKIPGLRKTLDVALDRDPARRPASALRFAEVLDDIVLTLGPRPTSIDLGRFVRDLFQDDINLPSDTAFGPSRPRRAEDADGDGPTRLGHTRRDGPPPPSSPLSMPLRPSARSAAPLSGLSPAAVPESAAVVDRADGATPQVLDDGVPGFAPPASPIAPLVIGILVGASLAIVGCLLALA